MTTNLGLYRDAFNVLLNEVNTEMKRISKLPARSETAFELSDKGLFGLKLGSSSKRAASNASLGSSILHKLQMC